MFNLIRKIILIAQMVKKKKKSNQMNKQINKKPSTTESVLKLHPQINDNLLCGK